MLDRAADVRLATLEHLCTDAVDAFPATGETSQQNEPKIVRERSNRGL